LCTATKTSSASNIAMNMQFPFKSKYYNFGFVAKLFLWKSTIEKKFTAEKKSAAAFMSTNY